MPASTVGDAEGTTPGDRLGALDPPDGPPTPSSAGSMNSASAAIAIAPASTASRGNPGRPGKPGQAGPRLDLRVGLVAAHPFPGGSGDRVAARAGGHRLAHRWPARRRIAVGTWRRRRGSSLDQAGQVIVGRARRGSGARRGPRRRHRGFGAAGQPIGGAPRQALALDGSDRQQGGRIFGAGRRSSAQDPRHRSPMAAAPPNRAAGCGAPVDRPLRGAAARRRRCRPCHRSAQAMARRSGRSPVARRRRGCGPPRASPSPGTSGRRGTRWTGSRPPGARRRAAPVATRRSSDGDGRGSSNVRRGRRQRRRMDRPGHRPCWAALAQSSRG